MLLREVIIAACVLCALVQGWFLPTYFQTVLPLRRRDPGLYAPAWAWAGALHIFVALTVILIALSQVTAIQRGTPLTPWSYCWPFDVLGFAVIECGFLHFYLRELRRRRHDRLDALTHPPATS